jgi:hypothetical protein
MPSLNQAFPKPYITTNDLQPGQRIPVRTTHVSYDKVGQDQKFVAFFFNVAKGFPLNKTNAMVLAKLSGSEDSEKWGNLDVVLFRTTTNYQGRVVDCLRLEPAAPANAAAPSNLFAAAPVQAPVQQQAAPIAPATPAPAQPITQVINEQAVQDGEDLNMFKSILNG